MARCRATAYGLVPTQMTTTLASPGSYTTDKKTKLDTYIPPTFKSVEANSDARKDVIHDCMYQDGWHAV